jgi:hypothetical protein
MEGGVVPGEQALQHADDVTVKDVRAIGDFLLPRLEGVLRAHSPDTEEHRIASALAESVAWLVLSVEFAITGEQPGRVLVLADSPAPAPQTDEQVRAQAKARLQRVHDDWNHLCAIAGFWSSDPASDGTRWHEVQFLDAEAHRRYDQQVARLVAEGVLRPPGPANLRGEGSPDNPG